MKCLITVQNKVMTLFKILIMSYLKSKISNKITNKVIIMII